MRSDNLGVYRTQEAFIGPHISEAHSTHNACMVQVMMWWPWAPAASTVQMV